MPIAINSASWRSRGVSAFTKSTADRLRVAWMAEIDSDPHDIEASLRHDQPTSAAAEQDLLDVVRKQLEWERAYDEAVRTGR